MTDQETQKQDPEKSDKQPPHLEQKSYTQKPPHLAPCLDLDSHAIASSEDVLGAEQVQKRCNSEEVSDNEECFDAAAANSGV